MRELKGDKDAYLDWKTTNTYRRAMRCEMWRILFARMLLSWRRIRG